MTDDTFDAEALAELEELRSSYRRLIELLSDAFDELHAAVVAKVREAGYVTSLAAYPQITRLSSGFPSFSKSGVYEKASPRHYISVMFGNGLIGHMIGYRRPDFGFPRGGKLTEFLREHRFGRSFMTIAGEHGPEFSTWLVDRIVADAVERYLHVAGVDEVIDPITRDRLLRPLVQGIVWTRKDLRLVVPIAVTHFDIDHFRLSPTAYVCRIPKKLQLARAHLRGGSSGAVESVVGAATHAFVSTGWELLEDDSFQIHHSLRHVSRDAQDTIDAFFGALRLATGVKTGYAQALWLPRKWALGYFADLPPVYGTTMRQYPDAFDNFAWASPGDRVDAEDVANIQELYRLIESSKAQKVRLAIRRLNTCMTRSDDADAVLDGAIGLEVLLNDREPQALSFKLRLRAGALAQLEPEVGLLPQDVASMVKEIYRVRSSIVHGSTKAEGKKAVDTGPGEYAPHRIEATKALRFVLDRLLRHPRYLEPTKIDEELLLGSGPMPTGE